MKDLSTSADKLKQYVVNMTHGHLTTMYDSIENVTSDLNSAFKAGLRIKQMFDILPSMLISSSTSIAETMNKMIELVTDVLECDKAIIYQIDYNTGELVSQAGTDLYETKRYKISEGVCGWTVRNKECVNIRELRNHPRFSKAVDIKLEHIKDFSAKTVLAIPIYNKSNEVEGVIQAFNKKPLKNDMIRYFSPDDIGLITMIAKIATLCIHNSTMIDKSFIYNNSLESIIKMSIFLNTFHNEKDLILATETKLKSLFSCDKANVFFLDDNKKEFYTYNENDQKLKYKIDCGLIGDSIKKKSIIVITDPLKEKNYNS